MLLRHRCAILFSLVAFAATPGIANDDFELTREGELLTLTANNASLVAIVDRLQELTEIKFTFSEPFDTAITTDIQEADLETLISSLVTNNLITKLDYQSHIKIAEVLLMPDGGEDNVSAANLPSGEPAEGIIVDGSEEPVLAGAESTAEENETATDATAPEGEVQNQ